MELLRASFRAAGRAHSAIWPRTTRPLWQDTAEEEQTKASASRKLLKPLHTLGQPRQAVVFHQSINSDGLQTKGFFRELLRRVVLEDPVTEVWGEGGFPCCMSWTPLPDFPYFVNNPQNVISSWKNKGFIA